MCATSTMSLPAHAASPGREELQREQAELARKNTELSRESAAAVGAVFTGVEADLEARRQALEKQVREWTEDRFADPTIADINRAIHEAVPIARANGLDVDRLNQLYDLGRRMIREADFQIPGKRDRVFPDNLTGRVLEVFLWAMGERSTLAEAEARHQAYRVGLYEKVMRAYLRALVTKPGDANGCTPQPRRVEIRSRATQILDCPDPVVQQLRDYVNALRTIASGEADSLIAQAEELVAEQQLVADVASVIPLVGDAVDIYAIWSGEDLAGKELTVGERLFGATLVGAFELGPHVLEFAIKRSPAAREAAETVAAYFDAAVETAVLIKDVYVRETRAIAADMAEAVAKKWNTSVADLRTLADRLTGARQALSEADRARLKVYQNLRDAAQDRISILDLPEPYRSRATGQANRRVTEHLGRHLGSLEDALRKSGMVSEHGGIFSDVARETNQILIVRPVNPDATRLIREGWATKPMAVKAKSASKGAIAGSIPVNQHLNKTGTALAEAREKLRRGQGDLRELEASVKDLEKKFAKGQEEIGKCFKTAPPCAKEIPHPDGVMQATDAATGQPVLVLPDEAGGWLNAETGQAMRPRGPPEPVMILGDPVTGAPFTADYDLLNFGGQGRHATPGFNPQTGFISGDQRATLDKINAKVRKLEEADGIGGPAVVHHGAEQNFPGSPGVDYPLTVFEPGGRVISIPECDLACMRRWCETERLCDPRTVTADPDRLLKDYFHQKRLDNFNLDPNPAWNWGAYNGLGGWLPRAEVPQPRQRASRPALSTPGGSTLPTIELPRPRVPIVPAIRGEEREQPAESAPGPRTAP
jgi:hypothetical protein